MENAIIAQNIKRYFKAGDGTTVHATTPIVPTN